MSKVTFLFTVIALKLQLFLRHFLSASGIRIKINPEGCYHLMYSESFCCPKVTWLGFYSSPSLNWFLRRNLELSVGNRKTWYIEMPKYVLGSRFVFLGLNMTCKDCNVFNALHLWSNCDDLHLQYPLGHGLFGSSPAEQNCVGLHSLQAVPGEIPWFWKGQFPSSPSPGTKAPSPFIDYLLSLLSSLAHLCSEWSIGAVCPGLNVF